METEETAENVEQKILEAFKNYMLENGKMPKNVYTFCKTLNMDEATFYEYYSSLGALKSAYWKILVANVVETLHHDENYSSFTVREKYLSFCFTLIEELKQSRSFYKTLFPNMKEGWEAKQKMKAYKESFLDFIEPLISEGKQSQEVSDRPLVSNIYDKAFYGHQLSLLAFFFNDDSKGFHKTDQYIEKSVNLAFDVLQRGVLESGFDFIKFMGKELFA